MDTSCLDWQDRIKRGSPLVPDLPLFEDEADRALRVFNRLRLPDVPGMPTMGEAMGRWFTDVVRALFGSFDAATNTRLIQEVFLLVPKKNSKSTGAAAIMLTAAIVNRRPSAEFMLVAPTKEIASISFKQMVGMIKADPELSKLFHTQTHLRTITHRQSQATLKVLASDTDTVTGVKATGMLIDETHEFAGKSKARDVFVEMRGALAARPDGFLMQITTQSKRPPSGVFLDELRKAREVRDGKRKLPLLPVLYELPPDMAADWQKPEYFGLVNPNLGKSVNPAFLERELETARDIGPEQLALFASQHLNVEIGIALLNDRWAGADYWQAQASDITLSSLIDRADVVTIGIDGGGLDDLLGLAVIGRDAVTREWLAWCRAWGHPQALERRKSEAQRYADFARDGDLTLVKRIGDDVEDVASIVEEIDASGKMDRIGVDQAGIGAIVDAITARGIAHDRIVGISQGWKLNGAIKTTERKLAEGTLIHAGQPLMTWCVSNARVVPLGNAVTITKQVSGSGKIDPLMALFNAATLMAMNPEAANRSISVPENYKVA